MAMQMQYLEAGHSGNVRDNDLLFTALSVVPRRCGTVKPCAFGAPLRATGLDRKLCINAVNGSSCLSLAGLSLIIGVQVSENHT